MTAKATLIGVLASLVLLARIGLGLYFLPRIMALSWYRGWLAENPARLDASVLTGKTIVIDAGHKGCHAGALGPRLGLKEADVNWEVAETLRSMLRRANPDVNVVATVGDSITRSEDDPDGDLNLRSQLARRAGPDLVVSVHHDAATKREPWSLWVNLTTVFYHENGSDLSRRSRLAAQCVRRRLGRYLLLPGFLIPRNDLGLLRDSHAPAIVTEASFITNPLQERLLAQPDRLRIEAYAIYHGILEYFAYQNHPAERKTR